MNLEESDKFIEAQKQNEKKKKIVLLSIIFCAILVVLLISLIIIIKYEDSLQLKLYIDGEQKAISNSLFVNQNNVNYVNIKEFSNMMGYTYTKVNTKNIMKTKKVVI